MSWVRVPDVYKRQEKEFLPFKIKESKGIGRQDGKGHPHRRAEAGDDQRIEHIAKKRRFIESLLEIFKICKAVRQKGRRIAAEFHAGFKSSENAVYYREYDDAAKNQGRYGCLLYTSCTNVVSSICHI